LVPHPSRRGVWRTLKPLPLLDAGARRIPAESSGGSFPYRRSRFATSSGRVSHRSSRACSAKQREKSCHNVGIGLLYQHPNFCRDRCLIGGMIGISSMLAPLKLRAKSRAICGADVSNHRRARGKYTCTREGADTCQSGACIDRAGRSLRQRADIGDHIRNFLLFQQSAPRRHKGGLAYGFSSFENGKV
jgi:hypothetical protein